MIIVTPPTLYGRLGAILSALIIACGFIGLTIHKDVYDHRARRDFYCYYTNLSNLVVLLYFAFAAPLFYARSALRRYIPLVEFSVAMCILLTHLVFHFVLFPFVRRQGMQAAASRETSILAWASLFTHYVVPLLTIAYWVLCAPLKQTLTLREAPVWTVLPLVYVCWIFSHAGHRGPISGTSSPYPYPFLDVKALGAGRAALNCLALYALCTLVSCGVVLVIQALYALFGGGHALLLI